MGSPVVSESDIMELHELVIAAFGPQPWPVLLLLVSLVLVTVGYTREKSKNDRVSDDRLKETREDTELLVDTVNEAVKTVNEFRASNEALRTAFNSLTAAVKQLQIEVEATPEDESKVG